MNEEKRPIARIDFLGRNGTVRESVEYTSLYRLKKDVMEENYYGVPMCLTLYRDREGNTVPHDFVSKLDPPLHGFSIEDAPLPNLRGGTNMTTSEYNTALYHKLYAEQERYRDWLLSQSPEEILNHCYECTVRQDILFALEENDLSAEQCKALLKLENPVADIFKDFEKRESDYMADILDTIMCRADRILQEDRLRSCREER